MQSVRTQVVGELEDQGPETHPKKNEHKTEVSVGTWIRVGKEVVDIVYKFLAAPKVGPKDKCSRRWSRKWHNLEEKEVALYIIFSFNWADN